MFYTKAIRLFNPPLTNNKLKSLSRIHVKQKLSDHPLQADAIQQALEAARAGSETAKEELQNKQMLIGSLEQEIAILQSEKARLELQLDTIQPPASKTTQLAAPQANVNAEHTQPPLIHHSHSTQNEGSLHQQLANLAAELVNANQRYDETLKKLNEAQKLQFITAIKLSQESEQHQQLVTDLERDKAELATTLQQVEKIREALAEELEASKKTHRSRHRTNKRTKPLSSNIVRSIEK